MSKKKEIKTEKLRIHKNIIEWENSMLQLHNISHISTNQMELQEFPKWGVILCIVGILVITRSATFGLICFVLAAGIIYNWYSENERLKTETALSIKMNSGNNIVFIFNNKEFLNNVWEVLREIIASGNSKGSDVVINIKDNYLQDNAGIFKEFKIKQGD